MGSRGHTHIGVSEFCTWPRPGKSVFGLVHLGLCSPGASDKVGWVEVEKGYLHEKSVLMTSQIRVPRIRSAPSIQVKFGVSNLNITSSNCAWGEAGRLRGDARMTKVPLHPLKHADHSCISPSYACRLVANFSAGLFSNLFCDGGTRSMRFFDSLFVKGHSRLRHLES